MIGMPGMKFTMDSIRLRLYRCGSCVNVCPERRIKRQAKLRRLLQWLTWKLPESRHSSTLVERFRLNQKLLLNSKRQQLREASSNSHSEFSGACAGCGETPYAKLITQPWEPGSAIKGATQSAGSQPAPLISAAREATPCSNLADGVSQSPIFA